MFIFTIIRQVFFLNGKILNINEIMHIRVVSNLLIK